MISCNRVVACCCDTNSSSAGAAGTFLARIADMSPRAFKAVIDIDLIGSFNTLKATLPYLEESARRYPATGNASKFGSTAQPQALGTDGWESPGSKAS